MARIRTIKPEFWQHEELSELSAETHMLAAALLNHADDYGFFKANPKLVEAACFPLRELSLSVHGMLTELSNIGYITLVEGSDGKKYGRIEKFNEHQRVNRPTASKIAALVNITEGSVSTQGTLTAGKERKGRERKGREYIFTGKVIKLTAEDFNTWKNAYKNLDLNSELQSLDDYYSEKSVEDWFPRCSAALAKRNRASKPADVEDLDAIARESVA
mgnify:CR=1 FL=1